MAHSSRRAVSLFILDEPELMSFFSAGRSDRRWAESYEYDHPPVVWRGDWQSNCDGDYETRREVVQSGDAFRAQLTISRMGGEPNFNCGEFLGTPDEEFADSRRLSANWHALD
ncbi:hypothetical protein [Massilia sp. YMA4]|uniref:hypothetical protein n=1 Tax=Massilia sp. YMA4 TaxID=1593482 RepID=UPI000DD164AC|nr:hypothetical protein [Massilia sp. YMA4]AXA91313.1 hypothetical protein DPH57_09205 [Massilia sp. YMA4]